MSRVMLSLALLCTFVPLAARGASPDPACDVLILGKQAAPTPHNLFIPPSTNGASIWITGIGTPFTVGNDVRELWIFTTQIHIDGETTPPDLVVSTAPGAHMQAPPANKEQASRCVGTPVS